MADISQEIEAFRNAVYGEEVRGSMISLANKVNDSAEESAGAVADMSDGYEAAMSAASSATSTARSAASTAASAASNANTAAQSANAAANSATAAGAAITQSESARELAEQSRAAAEQARVSAEANRASSEQARALAETTRVGAEANRVTNEATRQENESARATSEQARALAETTRVGNESSRQSAESARVTAEAARAGAFASIQDAWHDMEQQVLPPATASTLGGVIVGNGLSVQADGTLSFEGGDVLTKAEAASTYATRTSVESKAEASHVHSASDVTSGTLAVSRGGTGVASAAAERERLGLGSTTGAVPVANGGTGATTAADALSNLGAYSSDDVDSALAALRSAILSAQTLLDAIGAVPVANGGTGARDAASARSNLGITPANIGAATQSDMDDAEQAIADNASAIATLGESVSRVALSNASKVTIGQLNSARYLDIRVAGSYGEYTIYFTELGMFVYDNTNRRGIKQILWQ